jgi:hypothetical protein
MINGKITLNFLRNLNSIIFTDILVRIKSASDEN